MHVFRVASWPTLLDHVFRSDAFFSIGFVTKEEIVGENTASKEEGGEDRLEGWRMGEFNIETPVWARVATEIDSHKGISSLDSFFSFNIMKSQA